MNTLIYKIKNKLFRFSKEASKLKRPTYDELMKYKSFNRSSNNKFILSFCAGRCGQNWFSKIFNSHSNWIGTSERFADFEAFYRYISYYNLPIEKEGVFQLLELATNRDLAKRFRVNDPPIFGRLSGDCFMLDLRTLDECDFPAIERAVDSIVKWIDEKGSAEEKDNFLAIN